MNQSTPALAYILQYKIVAILRKVGAANVADIAAALYKGGINIIEVTLNSPRALSLIEELSNTYKDKMLIGAGTVLSVADAISAIDAGARFLISPTLDIAVIKITRDNNIVSIPGAYTPTEILTAYDNGADIIKVFPAQSPEYIKQILAPLDHIPLMPTGGIDIGNISKFKKAGASAYGIGSALVNNTNAIDEAYLQDLTAKATAFIKAIQ